MESVLEMRRLALEVASPIFWSEGQSAIEREGCVCPSSLTAFPNTNRTEQWNDDGGYDLIQLPGGQTSRVFTKQEFRIDSAGSRRYLLHNY